jgi:hypothetical protein
MLANAIISKGAEQSIDFLRLIVERTSAVFYFFKPMEAHRQALSFYAEPNEAIAFRTWNYAEQGFAKEALKLLLPRITFHRKISIARTAQPLSSELLREEARNGSLNRITRRGAPIPVREVRVTSSECYDLLNKLSPEGTTSERVQIRVLCSEKLEFAQPVNSQMPGSDTFLSKIERGMDNAKNAVVKRLRSSVYSLVRPVFASAVPNAQQPAKVHNKIIIFVHGGGFVSFTTRSA